MNDSRTYWTNVEKKVADRMRRGETREAAVVSEMREDPEMYDRFHREKPRLARYHGEEDPGPEAPSLRSLVGSAVAHRAREIAKARGVDLGVAAREVLADPDVAAVYRLSSLSYASRPAEEAFARLERRVENTSAILKARELISEMETAEP